MVTTVRQTLTRVRQRQVTSCVSMAAPASIRFADSPADVCQAIQVCVSPSGFVSYIDYSKPLVILSMHESSISCDKLVALPLIMLVGVYCETDIDNCQQVVCERGGTCVDLLNDYHCQCVAGYTGRRCEREVDECAAVTCQHGGRCVDLHNAYMCDCPRGYTGETTHQVFYTH